MARPLRLLSTETPYHIVQRGNYQQAVFHSDLDRYVFMHGLADSCAHYDISVIGYCLMTNHVHLLVVPHCSRQLSNAMQRVFHRHALYMNAIRCKAGHLWQSRFVSVEFDEVSVWSALRYIELNPVQADLVSAAEEWRWSSAGAHAGLGDRFGIVDLALWRARFTEDSWRIWLRAEGVTNAANAERIADIRKARGVRHLGVF
jgi:putative transposase